MAIDPGSILFTANFTNPQPGAPAPDESFSFIATENIAAGEVITFHSPEDIGNSFFSFTVGAGGLSAFDRVTINEETNVMSLQEDPSGGSVSAVSFTDTATNWSITSTDNIIASSNGAAIAGISNRGVWDQEFAIAAPTSH